MNHRKKLADYTGFTTDLLKRHPYLTAPQIHDRLKENYDSLPQVSDARFKKIIKMFDEQIKAIEKEILNVIKSDENIQQNFALLLTLPGIGIVNAVMTIVATSNFTRFQTARQYAKYA